MAVPCPNQSIKSPEKSRLEYEDLLSFSLYKEVISDYYKPWVIDNEIMDG